MYCVCIVSGHQRVAPVVKVLDLRILHFRLVSCITCSCGYLAWWYFFAGRRVMCGASLDYIRWADCCFWRRSCFVRDMHGVFGFGAKSPGLEMDRVPALMAKRCVTVVWEC